MRPTLILSVLPLLIAGCFHHEYTVAGTTPLPQPGERQWRHYLFNGIIDLNDDIDLRAACPQGVARIDNVMEVPNGILYIITATIYTSTIAEVYCQTEGAALPPPPVGPAEVLPPPDVPVIEQSTVVPVMEPTPPDEP